MYEEAVGNNIIHQLWCFNFIILFIKRPLRPRPAPAPLLIALLFSSGHVRLVDDEFI